MHLPATRAATPPTFSQKSAVLGLDGGFSFAGLQLTGIVSLGCLDPSKLPASESGEDDKRHYCESRHNPRQVFALARSHFKSPFNLGRVKRFCRKIVQDKAVTACRKEGCGAKPKAKPPFCNAPVKSRRPTFDSAGSAGPRPAEFGNMHLPMPLGLEERS